MPDDVPPLGIGLKSVFRDHPAAVTLITAVTESGPVGLTASSLSSVAVEPPAVSFSVTRATGTAGELLRARSLQVHFLADRHAELARQFSTSGGERFAASQGWSFDGDGSPRLADARARLTATIADTISVGGSVLVVAEVVAIDAGESGPPLMYVDRTFSAFDAAAPAL